MVDTPKIFEHIDDEKQINEWLNNLANKSEDFIKDRIIALDALKRIDDLYPNIDIDLAYNEGKYYLVKWEEAEQYWIDKSNIDEIAYYWEYNNQPIEERKAEWILASWLSQIADFYEQMKEVSKYDKANEWKLIEEKA